MKFHFGKHEGYYKYRPSYIKKLFEFLVTDYKKSKYIVELVTET